MPVEVKWLNDDHRQIVMTYDRWKWDEFYRAFDRAGQLMSQVNHRVSLIGVVKSIPGGSPVPHLRKIILDMPDQVRSSVVVLNGNRSTNTIVRIFLQAVMQALRTERNIQIVSSLEEAIWITTPPVEH